MMIEALKAARDNIPPCRPPFWARSGHLQTILGHLLPSSGLLEKGEELSVTLENERERIHTTYVKGESSIVVYLFHGLGGSAEATYMQRTALVARSLGHHVFINNHRGCGKGVGLATGPYHSGRAEDLSKVIAFGRKMFPDHRHIAVGFSLSANALLLLSAGVRAQVLPDFSICVNGPIHLDSASIKLTEGLNRIYDKTFVSELKKYIKSNRPEDLPLLRSVKDLRDFDQVFTAPIGGFLSREHYYESCSAKKHLKDIRIPTILLTADDDPFVNSTDYKVAETSSNVVLHIEKHGGHMGYITQNGYSYKRWLDEALKIYFQAFSGKSLSILP
jgi:predicted alpha/beta-fold hydrolase